MPDNLPVEAIFVLLILVVSFLSWIFEKMKRRRPKIKSPTPQMETPQDLPRQERPPPSESGGNTMREILESLGVPAGEFLPPEPPVVPSRPSPPPPPLPPVPTEAPARVASLPEDGYAIHKPAQSHGEYGLVTHVTSHPARLARRLVRSRGNMQTAIILKEILDNTKCFDGPDPGDIPSSRSRSGAPAHSR